MSDAPASAHVRVWPDAGVVVVAFEGTAEVELIRSTYLGLADTPGWRPEMKAVWDFRRADVSLNPAHLAQLYDLTRTRPPSNPSVGILLRAHSLIQITSQLFVRTVGARFGDLRVFDSAADAARWCGLPEGAL